MFAGIFCWSLVPKMEQRGYLHWNLSVSKSSSYFFRRSELTKEAIIIYIQFGKGFSILLVFLLQFAIVSQRIRMYFVHQTLSMVSLLDLDFSLN